MLKLMPTVDHLFTVATAVINVLRISFIETNDAGCSTEMEASVHGLCVQWDSVYWPKSRWREYLWGYLMDLIKMSHKRVSA